MKRRTPAIWTRPEGAAIRSIILLLVLVMLTLPGSLGRFSLSGRLSDSASVAEFEVRIIPLWAVPADDDLDLRFWPGSGPRRLPFEAVNTGEVDVTITPHIPGALCHAEADSLTQDEIFLPAGGRVVFRVVILLDGLGPQILETELFLDIRQAEGRQSP